MTDLARAREKMVDSQLRTEGVNDFDVLAAMGAVPRERFVPADLKPLAYIDEDLLLKPAAGGAPARFLMEPAPFGRLVELAELGTTEKVLIIGCGAGYSVAVVARLAATVIGLESDSELAAQAAATLRSLGVDNATVVTGSLEAGYPSAAAYDVILIEGAVELVPDRLFAQLGEGGRLVTVIGYGRSAQATIYSKNDGDIGSRPAFNADVRPLPGFRKSQAFVF